MHIKVILSKFGLNQLESIIRGFRTTTRHLFEQINVYAGV